MTQVDRLVRYIRDHPGCTSLDITYNLRIVNVTGRISDARHEGHVIDARREGGVFRYYLSEPARQLEWTPFHSGWVTVKLDGTES